MYEADKKAYFGAHPEKKPKEQRIADWKAKGGDGGKDQGKGQGKGKGKGKVLGRSPNSSVSVIPTCPKAQHATSYYTHQNSCNSGTVNSPVT